MSVQQIWSGLNTTQSNPFYANIENQGGNENAVLTTSNERERTSVEYPIELPTGSKKRILFTTGGWSDGKVYLRTSSGMKEATIKSSFNSEQNRVGLISDNPSDLIFLKGQSDSSNSNNNAIGVGGCIPDDAPDRYMGYECLDAVVLGDGTERLREEQIRAIRQYIKSGGVILFVGGAANSASSDPRWRDIFPLSQSTVVTHGNLSERIGKVLPNTRKIDLSKGSAYVRSYGIGLVVYLSINPFESPIRESEDRRAIVSKVIQRTHHQQIQNILRSQIGQGSDYDSYGYGGGYSSSGMPVKAATMATASGAGVPIVAKAAPMGTPAEDPFQIKPPSVSNIMWILIAYAIIVVPINFLVLRKLNKLELAWITTPIISVLFSGILLNSTIGLYSARATTRTTGVVILDETGNDTMSFGRSEMFFPRAQSTDLQLKGVESVLEEEGYRGSGSSGINLIDNGREVIAPSVNTGNLAFKELSYSQSSDVVKGLKITIEKKGGQAVAHIVNQSRLSITNLILYGPGNQKMIPEPVKAGASKDVVVSDLIFTKPKKSGENDEYSWQNVATAMPNKLIVFASTDAMHIGPGYGEGHPNSQYAFISAPQWGMTK